MLRNYFEGLSDEVLQYLFDFTNLEDSPALSLTCSRFSLFMQPYFDGAKQNSFGIKSLDSAVRSRTYSFKPVMDPNGISMHYEDALIKNNIKKLISDEPDSELSKLLLRKMRLALGDHDFINEIICYIDFRMFLRLTQEFKISDFSFGNYYHAIEWGNIDVVKFFIEKGFPVSHNKIQDGLQHGPFGLQYDPAPYGASPLSHAIKWNQTACAKLLLSRGATLNDPCAFEEERGVMVYPTFYLIDLSKLTHEMELVLQTNRQVIEANKEKFRNQNSEEIFEKTATSDPCKMM